MKRFAFAIKNENQSTKDLAVDIPNSFRNEAPYNNLIGPTQPRTGMNGVVIRRGYVVAEWGDTNRADMTFSVTKTFLSTVVGVAYDRRLIKDVNDKVAPYMPAGVDLFTSRAQRADHVGPPAAADERLVRRAVGQAGLGGSARARAAPRPADWPKRRCASRARSTSTTTRA